MKKQKIVGLILFVLVLVLSLNGCARTDDAPYETPAEDFEYQVNEDDILILKYIGDENVVVIPQKIDGKPVTAVADEAFLDADIVSVSIAATVNKITELAFKGCDGLEIVVFEGAAPANYDQTPEESLREGNYCVYFAADAEGAPEFDTNGWGGVWCDYSVRLRDDTEFSLPYGYAKEGAGVLTSETLNAVFEKVPSDKYEQYPGLQSKPVSATLYIDGVATQIDVNDPRLVKMMNFYCNTKYHTQQSSTQGSFNAQELTAFENDPNRLVLTYDAPLYEGENGPTRDGYDTIIVNTELFLCVKHGVPFGGVENADYPSTAYGDRPYYENYNWLALFDFMD